MTRQKVRTYPFNPPQRLTLDPLLSWLREHEPVSRIALPYGGESWLVTRYDDARQMLSDGRLSRAEAANARTPRMTPEPGGAASIHMMDGPEHARLRRLVARSFTARQAERMRPRVAAIVADLLTDLADRGAPCDFVEHVASRLPATVIGELLGVSHQDRSRFRVWSEVLLSSTAYSPAQVSDAIDEFSDYLGEQVEARRKRPTADLLGTLVAACDHGRGLSEAELVTFVGTLLVAGQETTASQLAGSVYTILAEPGLFAQLGRRPRQVGTAVEELLRYLVIGGGVSPAWIATEEIEVYDTVVRRGDAVMVSVAAANRDPAVFASPETIDLGRAPNPHLTFAPGLHHCLGAALARVELQESIRALVYGFPQLRLAVPVDEVAWRTGLTIRGPRSLPLAW